ncbi:MAG: hypothetical protein ACOVMT_04175 [Caulobacter sp.]
MTDKKNKRWSPADEARLVELAKAGLSGKEIGSVLARPVGGVRAKASELKVPIDSVPNDALRRHLAGDDTRLPGAVLREEIGGVIGVRWCLPSRYGETFCTVYCDTLLSLGRLVQAGNAPAGVYVLALEA